MNSPSHPVTIALVLQEVFEVLISRLWFHSPCKGTLGSGEVFHDSFMPSWNGSKVFGIISTGVNTMLLQLLSCIIHEVNWSSASKLKMLISNAHVWNYWCKTLRSSPLSYSKSADKSSYTEKLHVLTRAGEGPRLVWKGLRPSRCLTLVLVAL